MRNGTADIQIADQQIGQLYELMTAIREAELAENDPEYEALKAAKELSQQKKGDDDSR